SALSAYLNSANICPPQPNRLRQKLSVECKSRPDVAAAQVLDPGSGRFRMLPACGDLLQDTQKRLPRRLAALRNDGIDRVEAAKFLGSFAKGIEFGHVLTSGPWKVDCPFRRYDSSKPALTSG